MVFTQELKKEILNLPFFKGKVITGSMIPVINIDDEIKVQVKATGLKRFDIIVFIHEDKLVCHYLWNLNQIVKPILYQTRSMSGRIDVPIKEEDYVGKVISHRISLWRRLKILCLG